MAKRVNRPEQGRDEDGRRVRAKAALDEVIKDIHDDNRVLEGEELVKAIYEIFGVVRPLSAYKEPK